MSPSLTTLLQTLCSICSSPGPDIIVCDEGHVLRSSKSNLSTIVNQVKTRCRVVLTGTPLQNNLLECTFSGMGSMMPHPLHTHTASLIGYHGHVLYLLLPRLHHGQLCQTEPFGNAKGVYQQVCEPYSKWPVQRLN